MKTFYTISKLSGFLINKIKFKKKARFSNKSHNSFDSASYLNPNPFFNTNTRRESWLQRSTKLNTEEKTRPSDSFSQHHMIPHPVSS